MLVCTHTSALYKKVPGDNDLTAPTLSEECVGYDGTLRKEQLSFVNMMTLQWL